MPDLALVDLDGMIYAAGAVSEDVYYVVDNMRFDFKSEANDYCDTHEIDRRDIEKEVDAHPASHAMNALKTTLNAAVRDAGCLTYEAYLSPTDRSNFRFGLDPEYKANRKDAHKPVHFQALRDYAVKHLGAQVVTGMEADDIICIRACERKYDCVIVSVDKDMRQIPTYHFDWRKKDKGVQQVDEYTAWYNFYTQLLTGDSVDNIKGCPGIGPAKARTVLKDAKTDEGMLHAVFEAYLKAYDGDADEAREQMKLNAQLLRLLEVRP